MLYYSRPSPLLLPSFDFTAVVTNFPEMTVTNMVSDTDISTIVLLVNFNTLSTTEQQLVRPRADSGGGLFIDMTDSGSDAGISINWVRATTSTVVAVTNGHWSAYYDETVWFFIVDTGDGGIEPRSYISRRMSGEVVEATSYSSQFIGVGTKTEFASGTATIGMRGPPVVEPTEGQWNIFAVYPRILTVSEMAAVSKFDFPKGATVFHFFGLHGETNSWDMTGNGNHIAWNEAALTGAGSNNLGHEQSPLVIPASTNIRRHKRAAVVAGGLSIPVAANHYRRLR